MLRILDAVLTGRDAPFGRPPPVAARALPTDAVRSGFPRMARRVAQSGGQGSSHETLSISEDVISDTGHESRMTGARLAMSVSWHMLRRSA
jgi:hypothetical protein